MSPHTSSESILRTRASRFLLTLAATIACSLPAAPTVPTAAAAVAPPAQVIVVETPAPAPQTVAAPAPAATAAVVQAPAIPQASSRWKLLLTGFLYSTDAIEGVRAEESARRASYGGLVGLGYAFTPIVGANLYGGAHYARGTNASPARAHIGLDLEILPFGLRIGSLELVDLGLLAGVSNVSTTGGDIAPHAGIRANVNFGTTAVTTSLRANGQYMLLEGGIASRI